MVQKFSIYRVLRYATVENWGILCLDRVVQRPSWLSGSFEVGASLAVYGICPSTGSAWVR